MALSYLLSSWYKDDSDGVESGAVDSSVHPTKALAMFLTGLGSQRQPLLLDIGPVVGANVTFFGEEVGCKILVEDLFKEVDQFVREGRVESTSQLPAGLAGADAAPQSRVDLAPLTSSASARRRRAASTLFFAGTCSTTSTGRRRCRWRAS